MSLNQLVYGKWKRTDSPVVCISRIGSNAAVVHCGSNYIAQGRATMLLTNVATSMKGSYECVLTVLIAGRPPQDIRSVATLEVVSKYHNITYFFTSFYSCLGPLKKSCFESFTFLNDSKIPIRWLENCEILKNFCHGKVVS